MNIVLTTLKLDHGYINDYQSIDDALNDHSIEPTSITTTAVVFYNDEVRELREIAAVYTPRSNVYKTQVVSDLVTE